MSDENFSRCVCCGKIEYRAIDIEATAAKKHLVPAIPRVILPNGYYRIIVCFSCHALLSDNTIKEIRYQKLLSKAARSVIF